VDSKLVILGSSGGPTPKPERNATAHALVSNGHTSIIDCGSGVGRQIVRAGIDLASLGRVFITHHHIDHVADFGLLIHQSWSHLKRPVEMIGPPPIARMMEQYLELFGQDVRYRVVDEGRRELRDLVRVREITEAGEIVDDEQMRVRCVLVDHPPVDKAFAYRFDTPNGSLVFSGDTVPTRSVGALARGADVLVHEALYLDDAEKYLPADRVQPIVSRMLRVHSQPEGAGRIAQEAAVRMLVLSPLGAFGPVDEARLKERAAAYFDGEILIGRDLLEIGLPLTVHGQSV
jgi:ribonuclease BN (tRNA processing enzyme)